MKHTIFMVTVAAALLFGGCSYRVEKEPAGKAPPLGQVGFAQVQASVLGPRCARCHAGDILASYEAVTASLGEISRRIQLPRGAGGAMPPAGPLSADEVALVLGWIARGAPLVPGEGGGEQPAPPTDPAPPVPPGTPVPPAPPSPVPAPGIPSFAEVQSGVLTPKCARCHSGMMASYESVKAILVDIELSVENRFMPPSRAPQLTEQEREILLRWIKAGGPRLGDSGEAPAPPSPPPAPVPAPKPPDCEGDDDHEEDDFAARGRHGGHHDCDREDDRDHDLHKEGN